MGDELFEIASVQHSRQDELLCSAAFDVREEMLWTGSSEGSLASYVCPSLERYSTFSAHTKSLVGLLTMAEGVISVSADALRIHSRGGLPKFTLRDAGLSVLSCAEWERPGGMRVILGHMAGPNELSSFDLAAGRVALTVPGKEEVTCISSHARLLASGTVGGHIRLHDLRSLHAEHTVEGFSGAVTSIDMKGDLLVSCGLHQRMGQLFCDPLVKVFDVRQSARALTHIQFVPGPSVVRFQPKFSSTLLIASATGAVMLSEVQGGRGDFQNFQVDCGGDALTSCDISSSGELIAFADAGGFVHLWGTLRQAQVNLFSQPTDFPDQPQPIPPLTELESFDLPLVPSPEAGEALLSSVDPAVSMRTGMPPRIVDKALLAQMNVVEFVGYVPNTHWRRTHKWGEAARSVHALRNRRLKRKEEKGAVEKRGGGALSSSQKGSASMGRLPKGYRRVEIKMSQSKLKFEEFDFSYYNRTHFAGLENDILNSYSNSLLQVLYFIPELRSSVTRHVCDREFCLTCELGFVFHMLDVAASNTCQPSNLLRALRQIREASALGLVETPDDWENMKEKSLAKRIQSFNRFLLEQLHKEAGGGNNNNNNNNNNSPSDASPTGGARQSISEQLFGLTYASRTKCMKAPHEEARRETRSFQVDMQYPATKGGGSPRFSELVQRSLRKQEDIRAWCAQCRVYQLVQQARDVVMLPRVLTVNCCLRNKAELHFWHTGRPSRERRVSNASAGTSGMVPGKDTPPPDQWLPFTIHIDVNTETSELHVSETMFPLSRQNSEGEGGGTSASDEVAASAPPDAPPGTTRSTYELSAMIVEIHDEAGEDDDEGSGGGQSSKTAKGLAVGGGHLVAHVKVPQLYHDAAAQDISRVSGNTQDGSPLLTGQAGDPHAVPAFREGSPARFLHRQDSGGSQRAEWFLFNDFCITPTSPHEVVTFYGRQKIPCLLYYTRVAPVDSSSPTARDATAAAAAAEKRLAEGHQHETPPQHRQFRDSPISDELFWRLVNESRPRFPPRSPDLMCGFWPFEAAKESPRPGMLLGIDAEFVALSPAEKGKREDGSEFQKRPVRLGLARISVVRGEGTNMGVCCIDDYIRTVEPVFDYLTRYSGLQHGDLDPAVSTHHITTLKKAYIKLRYLVDKGCRFVGHGLKKDFRMINLVVPPEQIIDTVELFHMQHQRKLSLRFLASYLLDLDIQKETHDSIEDARTALRLYEKYKQLTACGEFHEKLVEIYKYGRRHGWEVGDDNDRSTRH